MVPESGRSIPARIFISVDFPAPFSPIRATISPAAISSSTASRAFTPGNDLEIPETFRTGGMSVASIRTLLRPSFEVGAEQPAHIALYFSLRYGSSVFREPFVSSGENRRYRSSRVAPFIDQLL